MVLPHSLLLGLIELVHVDYLEQCLAHINYLLFFSEKSSFYNMQLIYNH